jgi:hypothetical protein
MFGAHAARAYEENIHETQRLNPMGARWRGRRLPMAFPARRDASTPLKVCATVTDLGELAKEVAERVSVVFARSARRSLRRGEAELHGELSTADLLIHVGLELEIGWLEPLAKRAERARASRRARLSRCVDGPLAARSPVRTVDRSLGDASVRQSALPVRSDQRTEGVAV